MAFDPIPAPAFSAAAFRDRATRAVSFDLDALTGRAPAGDHVLNPGSEVAFAGRVYKDAAVLIPVVDRGADATVLMTRRTDQLASHSGQVAFPGGKIDAEDASPTAAALREAEEEVGLDPGHVEPLGWLEPYLTGSGYRIVPVVAVVRPGFSLAPNPEEVAEVFEVPLSHLMTHRHFHVASKEWRGATRYFYEIPWGPHYIWGVTAGIVRRLYERTYGPGA